MKTLLLLLLTLTLYGEDLRAKIDHIIVIYLENRSFDTLFRGFEGADTSDHPFAPYLPQSDTNGTRYNLLPMGDNGITLGLPPMVENHPFSLDAYLTHRQLIPDLIHQFYENQLQIHGGLNDRFVLISDQGALSMGYHDMNKTALWKYAKKYTLCDHFFMGAFGGSFLNHQWLIAGKTPYIGEDSNLSRYELDNEGNVLHNGILTPDGYAVNTVQPHNPPYKQKYSDPARRLPLLTYDTIGDRLSDANVSWGWYSGGFTEALKGGEKKVNYQYHHNPFLYFARYAPHTQGRNHLKDEKAFFHAIKKGTLPHVAFFKPSASDNQHPGYGTIHAADRKIDQIVKAVQGNSKLWKHSVIIITYDENGGLWDHVAPPQGDRWGPGTRIPAIIVSPFAKKGVVDHTVYDTTSILRLIEWKYDLAPVGERRSANLIEAF